MKYSAQVFDVEVPVAAARRSLLLISKGSRPTSPASTPSSMGRAPAIARRRRDHRLHRSRSIRPPALAPAALAASAEWVSRPVYWAEHGGVSETPVLRLSGSRLDEKLEGPMLIELPDTVAVLRPARAPSSTSWGASSSI